MAVMCSLQVGKQVRSTHVDQGLLFFTFPTMLVEKSISFSRETSGVHEGFDKRGEQLHSFASPQVLLLILPPQRTPR